MDRVILHCDMNNFFASVECMLDPSIKNLPVAVCGDQSERHGIVLARNYHAKSYGVSVGEPIWQAKNKCKDLYISNPPHYDQYEKYSIKARNIYRRYTDLVEPFGIDECYLDITNSIKLFGSPIKIANDIRNAIKKELDLTISVGVSFNKMFAKLGSDMKKPDAVTVISKDDFKMKIWHLPASDLFGVGRATKKLLDKNFIHTIGDIACETEEHMKYLLGKPGVTLHKIANGLDDTIVHKYEELDEVKSISHGITTVKDLETYDEVWELLLELSKEISYKLRQKKLRTTGVNISVRDSNLSWVQFQKKLSNSEVSFINIAKHSFELFKNKYIFDGKIRSISIGAYGLISEGTPEQISIFETLSNKSKLEKAEKCIEDINIRYGTSIIKQASSSNIKKAPKSMRIIDYYDEDKYNKKIIYDKNYNKYKTKSKFVSDI